MSVLSTMHCKYLASDSRTVALCSADKMVQAMKSLVCARVTQKTRCGKFLDQRAIGVSYNDFTDIHVAVLRRSMVLLVNSSEIPGMPAQADIHPSLVPDIRMRKH